MAVGPKSDALEREWQPPDKFGHVETQRFAHTSQPAVSWQCFTLTLSLHIHGARFAQELPMRAVVAYFEEIGAELNNVGLRVWTHPRCTPISHELVKVALQIILDRSCHPLLLVSSSGTHQARATLPVSSVDRLAGNRRARQLIESNKGWTILHHGPCEEMPTMLAQLLDAYDGYKAGISQASLTNIDRTRCARLEILAFEQFSAKIFVPCIAVAFFAMSEKYRCRTFSVCLRSHPMTVCAREGVKRLPCGEAALGVDVSAVFSVRAFAHFGCRGSGRLVRGVHIHTCLCEDNNTGALARNCARARACVCSSFAGACTHGLSCVQPFWQAARVNTLSIFVTMAILQAPSPRLHCEQFIELWDNDLVTIPATPPAWFEAQQELLLNDLAKWSELHRGQKLMDGRDSTDRRNLAYFRVSGPLASRGVTSAVADEDEDN
eukprot:2889489-Pleurochrysis_carterae.AAC.3